MDTARHVRPVAPAQGPPRRTACKFGTKLVARQSMPPKAKPDALVLSGGGVKGLATLGAVHQMQAAGVLSDVHTVVGTSAGAIVGALVATRKDLARSLDVICTHGYAPDFDFDRFFREFGLDSGRCIESMVDALLEGPCTFAEVKERHGVRLVVCVTNLSLRRAEYIGPDTHPDLPVATALRMSCSVPLYFSSVRFGGDWYVDGSITDNFPCDWAIDHGATRVVGVSTRPRPAAIRSFESFVGAVMESIACSQPCPRADILDLDIPRNVSSLNFGAPRADLQRLYEMGRQQAADFMRPSCAASSAAAPAGPASRAGSP